ETGRVPHILVWDSRDLLEAAFDGLYDVTRSFAIQGRLSVASADTALAGSAGLQTTVPLRVSWLHADQHRFGPDEDPGSETVADPARLLLDGKSTVRTFLLGSFGFDKTTAVARSLMQEDLRVLYVPGAAFPREVGATKLFLARCIDTEPLLEPRKRRIRKLELCPWHQDQILRFVQEFRETCTNPGERERLGALESLVADGRFPEIYGDIPERPLFLASELRCSRPASPSHTAPSRSSSSPGSWRRATSTASGSSPSRSANGSKTSGGRGCSIRRPAGKPNVHPVCRRHPHGRSSGRLRTLPALLRGCRAPSLPT
ncbi:MAG TPA: hypothetical protein VL025_14925, partial [Thermoanaerobaculia bacterium]|nr:hypothetical protein [Thermoanaerobaculia bacterium]